MTYDQYAALVMAHSGLEVADGFKRCFLCGESRPLKDFYHNRNSNGKKWLAARCNICYGSRPQARAAELAMRPKIYKNWFHVSRRRA